MVNSEFSLKVHAEDTISFITLALKSSLGCIGTILLHPDTFGKCLNLVYRNLAVVCSRSEVSVCRGKGEKVHRKQIHGGLGKDQGVTEPDSPLSSVTKAVHFSRAAQTGTVPPAQPVFHVQ